MINRFALLARAAATQAFNNFTQRQFVIHDRIQPKPLVLHQLLQRFGLHDRAREAIEDEAAAALQAGFPLAHHFPHAGVGDQLAAAHEIKGGAHGWTGIAIRLTGRAKDISGGEVTSAEGLSQQVGLRAFADSGRTQQNEAPGACSKRRQWARR